MPRTALPRTASRPPDRRQAGFTLIELMIVVVLSVMLLLTASTLFITMLISRTKTGGISSVKTEGDAAMAQIEFLLRNAFAIRPNIDGQTCELAMNEIALTGLDGGEYTLGSAEDPLGSGKYKIASISATATTYLTTNGVELLGTQDQRITFNCSQLGSSGSSVETIFSLRKGVPGVDQARDIVEQTFTSQTTLRNK